MTDEQIKASDLMKLMDVVKEATGLWNELERANKDHLIVEDRADHGVWVAWGELGDALRALGLIEVQP